MKTVIKNIHILTMDDQGSEFIDGAIIIDDDQLMYVGDRKGLPPVSEDMKVLDGEGMLALPGLINAHTHTAMSLFRGYANDLPLWEWLSDRMWPMEDRMLPEDAYWLSSLGMAEMLMSGVTAFSDMYMFMLETAQAVKDTGMRAVLSRGLQGPDDRTRQRMEEMRALLDMHGTGDGRIRVMVGPHAIYTCSPAYLQECSALAQEFGVGLHIHVSETLREVEDCMKEYNKSPVAHLRDLGVLEAPVLAAHCVHVNDDDIDILAEKDVRIVYCPASNMKLSSGFAPLHKFLDRGICVAIGTDSAASNNNLSIMKEMRLAALLAKGSTGDPTQLPAKSALRMSTRSGAKALGLEHITGSLEPGKKADIILVDTQQPHYYPRGDMAVHFVYSGHSQDVNTVIVNGKIIIKNRKLLTMDINQIYREVERIRKRIMR